MCRISCTKMTNAMYFGTPQPSEEDGAKAGALIKHGSMHTIAKMRRNVKVQMLDLFTSNLKRKRSVSGLGPGLPTRRHPAPFLGQLREMRSLTENMHAHTHTYAGII